MSKAVRVDDASSEKLKVIKMATGLSETQAVRMLINRVDIQKVMNDGAL